MTNYITGEKLQECVDHTIVLKGQFYADEQLKHTNCKYTYFEKNQNINSLPNDILNAKSLFVYTHILDFFFSKIYPLLKNPFVLVTHNSDNDINEQYKLYLNDTKIIKWFAQNVNYNHEKLSSLPIGIANSQWPHGNLNIFENIKNTKIEKTNLIYKNFEISTNIIHRNYVNAALSRNNIYMNTKKPYNQYLIDINQSFFNICPKGNGIDTHRMWESLYLGCIPVVDDCINNQNFKDLPILIVSNWNDVTIDYLKDNILKYKNIQFNYEKLNLNYWKNRIQKGE
jgi:hypothetical protein